MKSRSTHSVVGLVLGVSLFAVFAACSDSESQEATSATPTQPDASTSPIDSGRLPSRDATREAAPVVCSDASLVTVAEQIASTGTGIFAPCLGCLSARCQPELVACDQDCACRDFMIDLPACVERRRDVLLCVAGYTSLPDGSQAVVEQAFACAQNNCQAECLGALDAGLRDARADSASEGGATSDASSDASDATTD